MLFSFFLFTARFRVSSSGPELESTGPWEATVALEEGTITGEVTIELTLISPLGSKYNLIGYWKWVGGWAAGG